MILGVHLAWLAFGLANLCAGGRVLTDIRAPDAGCQDAKVQQGNTTIRLLEWSLYALEPVPLQGNWAAVSCIASRKGIDPESVAIKGSRPVEEYIAAIGSINTDWRPYVVLGVGELLGYIVRSITGFGSAIVIVACWTVCQTCGLDAGPFQSLIFADSICSLATAAPLVYITKPWHYASWKLVVTLLLFQAIGATVGAYLVQHLEPHNLQFAIATSLLVVFILMVAPLAQLVKHWKAAREPKEGDKEPLLPGRADAKGEAEGRSWRQWLGLGMGRKGSGQPGGKERGPGLSTGLAQTTHASVRKPASAFADMSQRRFSEDEWEIMRSRVRRLGRAGTAGSPGNPVPGPLAAGRASESESQPGAEPAGQSLAREEEGKAGQTAPLLMTRRQSDSASSLRAAEGSFRGRNDDALEGCSPASIPEESGEGTAQDADARAAELPPGPSRPAMAQQASASFRRREAERLRRFIAARQLSATPRANGEGPLDPDDPVRAAEEADPLAEQPSQGGTGESPQHKQAGGVGLEEVIRGSLSAELGSVLIGVVSHAGSPRPGSPARQGSIAHATAAEAALQTEASAQQEEAALLLDRSPSHKARTWTIATPKLLGAGALAGTSAGCLAALSGIGGPPLILMYELLAVPKQVVRATQTTMGVVSVKFFTYLLLGAGSWSNLPLYGMAIVCSLIGLNIGNAISKRMDQRMFSNLLLGIMLLSTALLYAASFGLTGR